MLGSRGSIGTQKENRACILPENDNEMHQVIQPDNYPLWQDGLEERYHELLPAYGSNQIDFGPHCLGLDNLLTIGQRFQGRQPLIMDLAGLLKQAEAHLVRKIPTGLLRDKNPGISRIRGQEYCHFYLLQ